MKETGIIRRIDDLGRVVIPKEIRRVLELKEGDPLEVQYNRNGEIVIRKYRQSFAQCCHDWYEENRNTIEKCQFMTKGEYTFCIVPFPYGGPTRAGHAKRFKGDAWDGIIGRVAAYANAMGRTLNKMVGYEE